MSIDPSTFKQVLRRWTTGVTVVTCRGENGIHGMTASSFAGVSLDPPLVLVCVDRLTRTHGYLREQQAFGIQILGAEMEQVSDRCAGFFGEEAHELADLPNHVEVTGAPILNDTLAWLDCSLWAAYDGGDHTIFVGEVHAAGAAEGRPLLWFDRDYRALRE